MCSILCLRCSWNVGFYIVWHYKSILTSSQIWLITWNLSDIMNIFWPTCPICLIMNNPNKDKNWCRRVTFTRVNSVLLHRHWIILLYSKQVQPDFTSKYKITPLALVGLHFDFHLQCMKIYFFHLSLPPAPLSALSTTNPQCQSLFMADAFLCVCVCAHTHVIYTELNLCYCHFWISPPASPPTLTQSLLHCMLSCFGIKEI